MNTENNKNYDELITNAMGREKPRFDFDKWKDEHKSEIQTYKSQSNEQQKHLRIYKIGKTIIKSPITKLAAAAVIIIVVLIGINIFHFSFDGTTAAYANVMKAVRNVPWMHIRYTVESFDRNGNMQTDTEPQYSEVWYSFDSKVFMHKYSFGEIIYRDYSKKEVHTYNPQSKRIVASDLSGKIFPLNDNSAWGWLESKIQRMINYGCEVTCQKGQYNGKRVDVFDIVSTINPDEASLRAKVFVDLETFLPIAHERVYINTETGKPRRIEKGIFDYPKQGPQNIYELGISSDVPTIDSTELPPWQDIQEIYELYKYQPPENYISIVSRILGILGEPVESEDICYSDGLSFRHERHFLFQPGPIGPQWSEQAAEIGDTYNSILAWAQALEAHGSISIFLYNENYFYNIERQDDGTWKNEKQILERVKLTTDEFWNMCPIPEISWPSIRDLADIVQDEYARENNLIRVEKQGQQFYLDPNHDYICRMKVDERGRTTEVQEFAQTNEGKWYPTKIKGPGISNTIYLETNPEFPEGIFDPNNLPID